MIRIFILFFSTAFLVGCLADNGSRFLGSWQNVKYEKENVEIVKNGSSYLISMKKPDCFGPNDCRTLEKKFTASLVDDRLEIRENGYQVNLIIEEKTGYLLINNNETYRKL